MLAFLIVCHFLSDDQSHLESPAPCEAPTRYIHDCATTYQFGFRRESETPVGTCCGDLSDSARRIQKLRLPEIGRKSQVGVVDVNR